MKLLEIGQKLVKDKEIAKGSVDLVADATSALDGDPFAIGRIIFAFIQAPLHFRERLFWDKFSAFLSGIDAYNDDRTKFCAKLAEDGMKEENIKRLITVIDQCETDSKIRYLIFASRSLAAGYIDREFYFRIVHAIRGCLLEDLLFLKGNVLKNEEYSYCYYVQGLLNQGLMYQSVIDASGNGEDRYRFTDMAFEIDQYALSFDDLSRYPTIISRQGKVDIAERHTEISNVVEF